jgi:sorting nexin-27
LLQFPAIIETSKKTAVTKQKPYSSSLPRQQQANDTICKEVAIAINLPDGSVCSITASPAASADHCYSALVDKIQLPADLAKYFYLFEIIDSSFERKLRPDEQPHKINAQNNSTSSSRLKTTSIRMKKWYFNVRGVENALAKSQLTLEYLFFQACEDLERNNGLVGDQLAEEVDLKFLKENHRYLEYLKKVSQLEGYGQVVFPHCACSSRKSGHVVVVMDGAGLKLRACSREGQLEAQVVEFGVNEIVRVDVDDEEMSFVLEVRVSGRDNRVIKISTGFVSVSYTLNPY